MDSIPWHLGGGGPVLISKTWYYYNTVGNPSRVMTRLENPGFNERKVTSTGLAYAKNGSVVTYVFGEEWDEGAQLNYDITYAREFRYDTGRARYLKRELDLADFENEIMTEVSSTWTDYGERSERKRYAIGKASRDARVRAATCPEKVSTMRTIGGAMSHGDFTAVTGSPNIHDHLAAFV